MKRPSNLQKGQYRARSMRVNEHCKQVRSTSKLSKLLEHGPFHSVDQVVNSFACYCLILICIMTLRVTRYHFSNLDLWFSQKVNKCLFRVCCVCSDDNAHNHRDPPKVSHTKMLQITYTRFIAPMGAFKPCRISLLSFKALINPLITIKVSLE